MTFDLIGTLGTLAGGIGLFLLGMTQMTDGLRLAAGPALQQVLERATGSRSRALGAGVLMTAVVQSSTAVTVAAIGFVNAGLLALGPALWVLFGANVGTTATGWIVAMVGLKLKVDALALPLVGLGAVLHLTGRGQRRGALGLSLAGFGLLFLGIALLQQAFGGLADRVQLPQGDGLGTLLLQLGLGVLLTVLVQSSSAAMTLTLTAAAGGLIDLQGAAAVVIGSNIGTTVTAVLAALGATPNARRAALAHVAFNVVTAVAALLLLPWLLHALQALREALGLPPDPATLLALFHTAFNLLGVALMWPLADRLTAWLLQRFRAAEEDESRPRHLDANVLPVPTLAVQALGQELERIRRLTVALARDVMAGLPAESVPARLAVVASLDHAVEAFVQQLTRATLPGSTTTELARVLRLRQHLTRAAEALADVAPWPHAAAGPGPSPTPEWPALKAPLGALAEALGHALADPPGSAIDRLSVAYERLRAAALAEAAAGRLALEALDDLTRRTSRLRRAVDELARAATPEGAPTAAGG